MFNQSKMLKVTKRKKPSRIFYSNYKMNHYEYTILREKRLMQQGPQQMSVRSDNHHTRNSYRKEKTV